MTLDEMIKLLGVKTQSEDSIRLCYLMDLEAFNMLQTPENDYKKEKAMFKDVYRYLMDQLGYNKLDQRERTEIAKRLEDISLAEEDSDYRSIYFHGLERTLLRYNRPDLILLNPARDPRHKVAYVLELTGNLEQAYDMYIHLGEDERANICKQKMNN